MKKIFSTILFSVLITGIYAQDIIVKKNGDEIQAKVVEVGSVEIKYKKIENIDGPAYTIPRVDVFMIKYSNGSKDIINDLNAAPKEKSTVKTFKSLIAVNVGLGIPMGTFGSSNPDDSKSAYALTGVDLNLSFTFPLVSYLRGGLKVGANIHSFDQGKFMNQFEGNFSGAGWSAYVNDIGPISRMYFMVGPCGIIPGEKISLDIRAFAGISSSTYPGYTFNASEYFTGVYITNTYESATSSSFVYDIGLGVLYSFTDKLSGMIHLDFISSNDEFTHAGTLSSSQNGYNYYYESVSVSARKPISVFAVTAGVGYTIGK